MRTLIVPAAGRGSRFAQAGYAVPKPFITMMTTGMPMLLEAIRPFVNVVDRIVIGVDQDTDPKYLQALGQALEEFDQSLGDEVRIEGLTVQAIPFQKGGAAYSVLTLGLMSLKDDDEVLVANCDQLFDPVFVQTWMTAVGATNDAGSMLTFDVPDESDARWSFVTHAPDGYVDRIYEKIHASNEATCGAYYARQWSALREALIDHISSDALTNGESYFAPCLTRVSNYSAPWSGLGTFKIPAEAFTSVGTPELLAAWEAKHANLSG